METYLRSTVIHATLAIAKDIESKLLKIESKKRPGQPLLRREETEYGFRIVGGSKADPHIILVWSDQGKGRRKITYDSRVISIGDPPVA